MIADLNVFNVKEIQKNKTYEAGRHEISFNLDKPGLYSVALIVNGGVLEKKFKVE